MDELLKRVLSDLGKTPEDFENEVEEMKQTNPNDVQNLKSQNESLNLQIIELWETLIDGGVA